MKVAVVGGGSSYTPELINGFLERTAQFPMEELWLVDILPERLEIVGGFAQRMVAAKGAPFEVFLTTDRREALDGASYVTTQLRVGWMQARREDEYLGRRHGLIGQETTGVGGMAKALRTIPVILDIARDMSELAPDAPLVNFTNPAGLVTEALARYAPQVTAVGVCNVPITAKMMMLDALGLPEETAVAARRAELQTLGLNHLSWHRGLTLDGEDLWPQVMAHFQAAIASGEETGWDAGTIAALQMIPNYYLQYFYYTARKLAAQQAWPPSRAEEVMAIEEELLAQYAEPDRTEPPQGLMQRGGAYYSTVATQLLNAHYNDLGET
ncbi:MAG: 6-phospho-beta-glucosidase, partial [Candidatus Promineifilaceae bacterium]